MLSSNDISKVYKILDKSKKKNKGVVVFGNFFIKSGPRGQRRSL